MNEFDFPKLAAYYTKVLSGCLRSGGKDWRWKLYKDRLDRIAGLASKPNLNREDREYLEARTAVASVFG